MVQIVFLAAVLSTANTVDVPRMWSQLNAHCAAGRCELAEGSKLSDVANTTDCKGRLLAYEYGLKIIPARKAQLESFDALNLATSCGVTRPSETIAAQDEVPVLAVPEGAAKASRVYHVAANGGDDRAGSGSVSSPFASIHRALAATRAATATTTTGAGTGAPKAIVLEAGVHYLNATIQLGVADSGLTITAAPGAEGQVTVSGGQLLKPTWTKSSRGNPAYNIYETPPNADPTQGAELCTNCWHNGVANWHHDEACVGTASTVYMDLRACDNNQLLPSGQPWDHSPYGPMGNYFC
eukprot:gene24619-34159_t